MADLWPTEEQSRQVAIFLHGADDFQHGGVDWLAVGRLGGNLARAKEALAEWPSGPPRRAKAALAACRAIVSGDRPTYADERVSFETLGAVYYMLTAGQYTMACANQLSPQGTHRWRFTAPETADAGHRAYQVCDYCGDERWLPRSR